MDADHASFGDELRASRGEYRHTQSGPDSRGFSGVGLTGVDPRSNGSSTPAEPPSNNGFGWTTPSVTTAAPVPQQQANPANIQAPVDAADPFSDGPTTTAPPTTTHNSHNSLFTAAPNPAPATNSMPVAGTHTGPQGLPAASRHGRPEEDAVGQKPGAEAPLEDQHAGNPLPNRRPQQARGRNGQHANEDVFGNQEDVFGNHPVAQEHTATRNGSAAGIPPQTNPLAAHETPEHQTRVREHGADSRSRPVATQTTEIDIRLIMRLLLASDELGNIAAKAESGDASVAELAEAARRSRSEALAVVSAWYGGTDQMVDFAHALLQAAAEPS